MIVMNALFMMHWIVGGMVEVTKIATYYFLHPSSTLVSYMYDEPCIWGSQLSPPHW